MALSAVCLLGLFGYFFLSNNSAQSNKEKAKSAAVQLGDTVRDQGVAGLVGVRLKSKFGLEATRFLHTYFDEGRVLVYGLLPESVSAESVREQAAKVVGVTEVEVLVAVRPAFVDGAAAPADASAVGG
jgi:hypothetical protein